jgi:exopolysaccharide biosynthesis polyprenyl glycosylphosphotransferase
VILALPLRSLHMHASAVALACEEQGIILRLLCNLFDLKLARRKAEEFEGDYVITHYNGKSTDEWNLIFKRVIDFAASLALLILLAPVLVVTAILIKLTSSGPVFFAQERLGQNKRTFHIYKFRTMVTGAEKMLHELESLNEVSGPVFKMRNDPRITLVGKALRKLSIDELPQLFNVFKGDMSLVGPRPLPVRDYQLMAPACPDWQCYRFSVKPGITCLWQINGRNSIPFDQWMELDRQYIQNWSLWLDLQILFRTIPVILRGTGV